MGEITIKEKRFEDKIETCALHDGLIIDDFVTILICRQARRHVINGLILAINCTIILYFAAFRYLSTAL